MTTTPGKQKCLHAFYALGINGPGNILIVVVASGFAALGGGPEAFPHLLGASVIAGVLQVIIGALCVGRLGDIVPPAVVHGMLSAIGVIIIGKQTHVMFGRQAQATHPITIIEQIPQSLLSPNIAATVIGLLSLFILVAHPRLKAKLVHFIPAPLWVVIFAIPVALLFEAYAPSLQAITGQSFALGADLFVSIPEDLTKSLAFPDFSRIGEPAFWVVVVTFCLVLSIENVVIVKAVDNLDTYRRQSELNRDLVAMGLTTIASGFAGGLPVITVIARSSVNVNHGAKTGWSNFFHGAILLVFVLAMQSLIQEIALAALAGILVYTGWKLTSPAVIADTLRKGPDHFLVFMLTILGTLMWGVLWGLVVGLASELLSHLLILGLRPRESFARMWGSRVEPIDSKDEDATFLRVRGVANFLTVPRIRRALTNLPERGDAILDFGPTMLVDNTVLEYVHDFGRRFELSGERRFHVIGLEAHRAISDHPDALHAQERRLYSPRLTQRQERLAALAKERSWEFIARRNWDPGHLDDFGFFRVHPVEFRDTCITGALQLGGAEIDLTLCDVTFEEGTIVGEVYHTTTLVLGLPFEIPHFIMEKEDRFLDRALAFAGFQDIDFKRFTKFSKRFVLMGPNEQRIRELMAPQLLEFFENERVYHLESVGDELVIFETFMRRATVGEVENMLGFAERLVAILASQAGKLPTANEEAAAAAANEEAAAG